MIPSVRGGATWVQQEWRVLERGRRAVLSNDAQLADSTEYGQTFTVGTVPLSAEGGEFFDSVTAGKPLRPLGDHPTVISMP